MLKSLYEISPSSDVLCVCVCIYIKHDFYFLFKKFFNHYLEAHFSMRHFLLPLHGEVLLFRQASYKAHASYSLVPDFREPLQVYECIAIRIF